MLVVAVSGCGALTYSLQGQALTVIDQLPAGAKVGEHPARESRGRAKCSGQSAAGGGRSARIRPRPLG
jgi:hypothetical protein